MNKPSASGVIEREQDAANAEDAPSRFQAAKASERITGKVAAVLNARRLVINRGSEHGVEPGMRFRVLEELNVTDPDTGERLGELPREVVRVAVIDVEPRYAIAHTFETYTTSSPSIGGAALSSWLSTLHVVWELRTPDQVPVEREANGGRRFAVVDRGYLVEQTAA